MRHQHFQNRRGFSLFEMIIVIGGLALVLGLCATLLHMLFRLDRSGRDALRDSQTLATLARQFRRDVRSSQQAKADAPGSLELKSPDGPTLAYRVDHARLIREQGDGKTIARREAYAIERLGPIRFEVAGDFVRLRAERHPENTQAPPRPTVLVEAALASKQAPAEEDRR